MDRPVLSVSNRQIPMLRAYGGHGAAGEDQPRSGVVAMVTRSPRVRPVQGDNLPRWQAASGGAAVGAGCFASFGNKVYEHRSGELLGDRVHDHDVKPAAHADRPSSAAAYLAEAGLLVAADRGLVPGKHHQVHVVQPGHGEGSVEHQPGGLRPQPLATPLAQHDPEGGRPMPVINVDEAGCADRLQVEAVIDGEGGLAGSGLAACSYQPFSASTV